MRSGRDHVRLVECCPEFGRANSIDLFISRLLRPSRHAPIFERGGQNIYYPKNVERYF
jgi:hypothetical protein